MKVCFFAHYSITNSDGATLSMYIISLMKCCVEELKLLSFLPIRGV